MIIPINSERCSACLTFERKLLILSDLLSDASTQVYKTAGTDRHRDFLHMTSECMELRCRISDLRGRLDDHRSHHRQ
jgi:hypothetical protein